MPIPIIVGDFETYYDVDYSLSRLTTEEYIRDSRFEIIGLSLMLPGDDYPQWYTDEEVTRVLHSVNWSKHAFLCHHSHFDAAILAWIFGIHPKLILDSMAMGQPHFGFTSGVSLGSLMKTLTLGTKGDYVTNAKGKRRRDFTAQELHDYGVYSCNDTWGCKMIYDALRPMTPTKELLMIDEAVRCFTDPRIVLDHAMLVEYHQEVLDTKIANYMWAGNLLGVSHEQVKDTIMSNDKLATLLMELGVDPPTKLSPATGKLAYAFAKTDDDFLALKEHENEAVQLLVTCRIGGKSTLAETRAKRMIEIAQRGTLPVYLKYYAAHTGRLGGGDAMNLQNLTRKSTLRRALMAPPNHVLVAGDLSQIEARILVTIAGQEDVVHAFREYDAGRGPDIYCVTASAFLGRPITKEANPKERQLGKVIRLALGYGMGIDKFIVTAKRDGVILTPQTAATAHAWYRDNSAYIERLWRAGGTALRMLIEGREYAFGLNDCIIVKGDGIHLPSGRVLRYPGLEECGVDTYNRPRYRYLNRKKWMYIYGAKVIENICQSLAGSVCGDGWLRLRGKLKIVLQAHDELVGVVHQEQAEWASQLMQSALTAPANWLPTLPIAANVGYAIRYGDIEK